eukprot:420532_1
MSTQQVNFNISEIESHSNSFNLKKNTYQNNDYFMNGFRNNANEFELLESEYDYNYKPKLIQDIDSVISNINNTISNCESVTIDFMHEIKVLKEELNNKREDNTMLGLKWINFNKKVMNLEKQLIFIKNKKRELKRKLLMKKQELEREQIKYMNLKKKIELKLIQYPKHYHNKK